MINFMQNEMLDGGEFYIENNSDIGIILVHGFTATPVEVKPLANALAYEGYSVFAPLLPGHNTTPDDLNNTVWQDWIDYVDPIVDDFLHKYKSVFIGGESLGAIIACYLASKYTKLNGILLYSPALIVKNLFLSRYMRFFKKYIHKSSASEDDSQIDGIFPWKGYRVNPSRAAFQLFLLQQEVKKRLSQIDQPMLIFRGLQDKTIDQAGIDWIINHVSSTSKEVFDLLQSGHCLILEKEHDFVFKQSIKFIKQYKEK